MKKIKKDRIAAFYLAAIITVVVIGSMIIYHEESSDFKEFLISLTGHHWVTKSVFAILMFPILSGLFYYLFSSEKIKKKLKTDDVWLWTLFTVVITIIFIFGTLMIYIFHYYGIT